MLTQVFVLQISAYACKCMTAIWNLRYNSIHCCANLLAGLARYHVSAHVQVILYVSVRRGRVVMQCNFLNESPCAVESCLNPGDIRSNISMLFRSLGVHFMTFIVGPFMVFRVI